MKQRNTFLPFFDPALKCEMLHVKLDTEGELHESHAGGHQETQVTLTQIPLQILNSKKSPSTLGTG